MLLMDKLAMSQKVSHVLYPDDGAMKRYSGVLPFHFLVGEKKRDWNTGKIEKIEIEIPEGEVVTGVLIVDDLCSYGGTFVMAAAELERLGITNNFLYVSHCEQSIVKGKIPTDPNIKHVYVKNRCMYDGSNEKITFL
jgi:ribose-phosphate pyrophosphokinase